MALLTVRRTAAAVLVAAVCVPFGAGTALGGSAAGSSTTGGSTAGSSTAGSRTTAGSAAGAAQAPDRTSAVEARRVDRVKLRLDWTDCSDKTGGTARAECAVARLPLDYDEPDGPTVGVAVLRIRATDQARRIGTLFLNPGGPGVSATETVAGSARWLGAAVRERFDVVGFDPRGVGGSDRVRCWRSAAEQQEALKGLDLDFVVPRTPAQENTLTTVLSRVAAACSTTGQPLVSAASTTEVARDMDVLRRALGDSKLTYYGESYGTYLGNVYANLFPDRVRAITLDGVIDPLQWVGTPATRNIPQAFRGEQDVWAHRALRGLLERCGVAGPARCRFAATGDPWESYQSLLAALRRAPVQLDGESMNADQLVDRLFGVMFVSTADELVDRWLTEVWTAVHPGTTTVPPATAAPPSSATAAATGGATAEQGNQPGETPGETPGEDADLYDGSTAVICTDAYHPADLSAWPRFAALAERRGPVIGPYLVWGTAMCSPSIWTAQDEDVYRGPFDRRAAARVLVVGSPWDPSTSYQAAVNVSKQLPGARLLTADAMGHVSYDKSRCVGAAVDAYLLAGTLPATGTVCPGNRAPFGVPSPAGRPGPA